MQELRIVQCELKSDRVKDNGLSFGINITEDQGTHIDMFPLEPSAASNFVENAPEICRQVLKQVARGKALQDVAWTYTTNPARSAIDFLAIGGYPVAMVFRNGYATGTFCAAISLEEYDNAQRNSTGIEAALQVQHRGHLGFVSDPVLKYIVHTPKRPQRLHVVNPCRDFPSDEKPVILVDSEKFITHWLNQSVPPQPTWFDKIAKLVGKENREPRNRQEFELVGSTFEKTLQHSIPHEMAIDVGIYNGTIGFTDGRHRTVNMAKAGGPYVPVQASTGGLDVFCALFEWEPAKQYRQENNMRVGLELLAT